ncbi:MAG: polysaccharide biosynthesis protein [Oscillospiraceae bacterium]|nr:polysaccharide biosynthesis protein [Oscillospiraceae bacterium]
MNKLSKKKDGQSFLEGTVILVFATMVVKVIGAIFKIPLSDILGEVGYGYFTVAYGLFTPLYSLAMAGLPVAVARMVSQRATQKRYRDVKKILRVSTALFTFTGALGSLIMVLSSGVYARTIARTPAAFLSIICLAPAVFFCCMMSSRRGYYEGLKNMYPTAISQMLEAVVKLVFGLLLSWLVIYVGTNQFESTKTVFGTPCADLTEAMSVIYPFSSAAAILGVTLSTAAGALYLHIKYKVSGDNITPEELLSSPPAQNGKSVLRSLLKIAIPVSLGTLATTLTTFIDSSSVINRLDFIMDKNSDVIVAMYNGISDKVSELSEVSTFIYGAYGYAINVFNLIPTLTTAFAISALPSVTSAWTLKNKELTKKSVETVLRITSLLAFPAGIGISLMSKPILKFLYPSEVRALGVEIATPALSLLGIAVIFVALLTPINSMLQAVGRADLPVKLMLIGGSIKIVTNFILVSIPQINVKGAPIGTILCYVFLFLSSMYFLCKRIGMVPDIKMTFLKPLIAGTVCGVVAYLSYMLVENLVSQRIATVISIIFAAVVYAICLLLLRAITKDDIILLPKGKNIVKMLEKKGLIG